VIHFSADGRELGRFGESGDGDGQLHLGGANSIAVTPDGSVLVADSWQKRIQRFSPSGAFREAWSSLGSCPSSAGDLLSAWDVAADPAGGAFITSFDSRVLHFGSDGVVDEELGIRGDNPGQFHVPGTLDVGADGTLTVNDEYNDRVQRFRHVAGSAGCGGSPPPEPPASPEQPSSPSTPSTPSETPASPPQFGIVGVGDITAPSLGLTPYQRGGISAIGFEATCSEDCTITASPRATVEVGRRERTVEMPEVTQAVAAGTQQHVALKPSDELVAALYQALTTRGGDASVRVDLKAVDGAGNVRDGSVEIELGWGR
jgi:hypothetical protein